MNDALSSPTQTSRDIRRNRVTPGGTNSRRLGIRSADAALRNAGARADLRKARRLCVFRPSALTLGIYFFDEGNRTSRSSASARPPTSTPPLHDGAARLRLLRHRQAEHRRLALVLVRGRPGSGSQPVP